jgi:nicotinate-nucleotide adenylyltransferase
LARIGILGGTFNPPHLGHLVCAQEAHAVLDLDRVVLMPAAAPPHKAVPDDPGPEVRFELCRLATAKDARLAVSRVELDRPGRSYTVDTLAALRSAHPEDDLTFIVGGDMAASLPAWREPERVISLAGFAVAERAGHGAGREEILVALEGLPGAAERLAFFPMPRIDISSTEIRRRVAQGRPIRYLVPDEVAGAIGVQGLYREGVRA